MSTFAFPTDTVDEELAANMDTFVGKPIAIRPLDTATVSIKTSFGQSPALRVQVIDLESGVLTSPHLLFWSKVQEQVVTTDADWSVGVIESIPQKADPTRSVYLLRADSDLDVEQVGTAIAKAEQAGTHRALDNDGPF
jgi:hypothetical protein